MRTLRGKFKHLVISLFLVFVIAQPAFADEYHYNNLAIGERPAGMGGAYTAVSDDPSGAYYNPAGIVFSTGQKISASLNSYSSTKTIYKQALGGLDYVRTSSTLLPNFFGITQPLGKGVLGISYAVPDSVIENQNQKFYNFTLNGIGISEFIFNFKKEDHTYLFGPTYAMELSNGLSVGLTLYYQNRVKRISQNSYSEYTSGRTYLVNVVNVVEEAGLKPILGIMWSPPAQKYSLGLTASQVKNLSKFSYGQTMVKPSAQQDATISFDQTLDYRSQPQEIKLGIAYFPSNSLLLAADLSKYSAVEDVFGTREGIMNLALGVEYYPTSKRAYRAGFYTNYANTPKVGSAKNTSGTDHVDINVLTGSVSFFTRNTSLTFGASYGMGSGQSMVISGLSDVQDVEYRSLALYIGSSYSF